MAKARPAPEVARGGRASSQASPWANLVLQLSKGHLKASVAIDPEKNTSLLKHYGGLKKYLAKLKFALQLKLDRIGSVMTASETHASASADKAGFEDGWMDDSMVASSIGLLMLSSDKTHKERLSDQLSTMEQRPH